MTNKSLLLFYKSSETHKKNALDLFNLQYKTSFDPYENLGYQVNSLIYPISHVLKTIISIMNIVKALCLFPLAMLSNSRSSRANLMLGFINELYVLQLNTVNIVTSIACLFTRNLATLFNFGYKSKERSSVVKVINTSCDQGITFGTHLVKNQMRQLTGLNLFDEVIDLSLKNVKNKAKCFINSISDPSMDKKIYNTTLSFN